MADRATPCRLSRELSSTSTAAAAGPAPGLTAAAPAVPDSSALATCHTTQPHTHTHGCQSDQHPPPTPPSEIGEQRTTCSRASVSVPRLRRASPIGSEAAAPTGGPRAPRSPGKQAAAARPPRTGPGGASPRSSAWSRPSRPARPPREVDGWVGFLSGSRIGGAGRPAAVGGLERNFAAGRERDAGGVGTCGDDESGAGFPFLRLLLPFARRQAGRERG